MIVYYDKETGNVIQTVQDRIHNPSLEKLKPVVNGINTDRVGIMVIKFVPIGTNMPYEPDVEPDQKPLVYELEQTGKVSNFKVIDGKLTKNIQTLSSSPEPIKTILVDLRPTEEEIFNSFDKDLQVDIKQAESNNLVFRVGTHHEKDKFISIFEQMKAEKGFERSINHYFENMQRFVRWGITLYFVEEDGTTLAEALVLPTKIPEYRVAATTPEGRTKHAGFFLIWDVIKDLKSLGFELFNLGGIYDENSELPIEEDKKNINLYKQKWGGVEVTARELNQLASGEIKFDSLKQIPL